MSRGPVVVTGATGFIGAELCARFRRAGRPLLGLARRNASRPLPDLQVIGDLRNADEATLDEALSGAEAVVHLAGRAHVMKEKARDPELAYREMNADVTARVARAAARAGVRRFVLASSVKVMGEETEIGKPYCADDVPEPEDAYARSKLAAERALFDAVSDSKMAPIVLRLPLVYGRHARGNFARLVAAVLRRRPLPFGAIENRRSILYVRNLAAAIEAALDVPMAPEGVHFVADALPVSTPDLVRAVATAWQVPARLTNVPVWALELGGMLIGRGAAVRRVTRTLEVDTSSFREMTGWNPHYTLDGALARIAAHSKTSRAENATTRARDLPSR
jgi:nucleoside-diphosphate-sugar epimerase